MGNLRLLKSRFGSGWLLDGSHPKIKAGAVKLNKTVHLLKTCNLGPHVWSEEKTKRVSHVKTRHTKFPEFLEAEELGTVAPKRCLRCSGCKDCSVLSQSTTKKEQEELRLIQGKMTLDKTRNVMVCEYPVVKDPSVLTDNRGQVTKMAESLEKKLKRDGSMEEYNDCLQEMLDRGCMRELTDKEMDDWGGVVNYISR